MGNPAYTNVAAERASDPVTELALDLSWAWNHATDELWRELEPELWEITQNPWLVLQSVSRDRLQQVLSNPSFREWVGALLESKCETDRSVVWF